MVRQNFIATRKKVPSRPCMCGCVKTTSHPKGFASRQCLEKWRAENPGNGRYVNERWLKMPPTEPFPRERKELCDEKVWLCQDLPFHVRTNTDHPTEFPLFQYIQVEDPENPEIKNTWEVVDIFDCLIDAQRAATRFGREVREAMSNDKSLT